MVERCVKKPNITLMKKWVGTVMICGEEEFLLFDEEPDQIEKRRSAVKNFEEPRTCIDIVPEETVKHWRRKTPKGLRTSGLRTAWA